MMSMDKVRDDLTYVAEAVQRDSRKGLGLPAILMLWAVLIPVGFALADFAPEWCGLYWLIVGPVGGVISGLLGHRAEKNAGVRDRSLGRRHAWHWLTMGAAYLLIGATIASGHMNPYQAAPIWLLITALAYTLAGIHIEDSRGLLPAGIIMFFGYAALVWLPLPYPWTVTGLIVSASLVIAAMGSRASPPKA